MPKPQWSSVFFMSIIMGLASALLVGKPPQVIATPQAGGNGAPIAAQPGNVAGTQLSDASR